MAPLLLEGNTLGEKRRSYNKLVNEAISQNSLKTVPKINYEEQDIDNLFKIDIASHHRDVDYILEVLKCKDMLYVSRAIKQSTWMIQNNEYAHIINPTYLYDNLFPEMTFKARNKLMLQIRLHLKEETRVEEFCKYILLQDLKSGFKWLPHCSVPFIEEYVDKYADHIPMQIMKRLCRRSFTFVEIAIRSSNKYNRINILTSTQFLLRKHTEKYLDIALTDCFGCISLGPKATKIIMKTCPNKIINNLENDECCIDIPTFTKLIKKQEINSLLMKIMNSKKMKQLVINTYIKNFLKRLPKTDDQFIKQILIAQTNKYLESHVEPQDPQDLRIPSKSFKYFLDFNEMKQPLHTSANIYQWYEFVTFNTAFQDLKNLISTESDPNERNEILAVLISNAGQNWHYIQSVVQYYHENHINESNVFKKKFVNNLISKKGFINNVDRQSWEYINDIFISMEVYEQTNNNVQSCVKAIILYNVIHDENIPKIIEQKFVFKTLKSYKISLQKEDKEKVFNYLYKLESDKLGMTGKFNEEVCLLKNILKLLIDWDKDLAEYPQIIQHIKKLCIKKPQSDNNLKNLSTLYNMKKSWRKLLFEQSILLDPTPEVCMNVLKHDPKLLNTYKDEIKIICNVYSTSQKRLLNKVRTFWWQSLADFFISIHLEKIKNKNDHNSAIFGLTILLPQKQYIELVHQYAPTETIIDWKQNHEAKFSISRNIGKKMHLARPQITISAVVSYAKGCFLQYAMPSLNAVLYNMSCFETQNQLKNLLETPVSLRKHGIRIALRKLKYEEQKNTLISLWNSTKNSSIRAVLMQQVFYLLCGKNNLDVLEEIWDIFNTIVDDLTSKENRTIYITLTNVQEVHPSIRCRFVLKSYKFLSSLPIESNCCKYIKNLKSQVRKNIQEIDTDVIVEIFMDSLLINMPIKECDEVSNMGVYLLSANNDETQNDRFNKILSPILDRSFNSWNQHYSRYNTVNLVNMMFSYFEKFVLNMRLNIPVVMFSNMLTQLDASLSKDKNYILITTVKLAVDYLKILDKMLHIKKHDNYCTYDKTFNWKPLYLEVAPEFGKICLEYLKEDVKKYYPSIYVLFADSLAKVFTIFGNNNATIAKILETFLEREEFIEGYLLVLHVWSEFNVYKDDEVSLQLRKVLSNPSREVQIHTGRYNYLSLNRIRFVDNE